MTGHVEEQRNSLTLGSGGRGKMEEKIGGKKMASTDLSMLQSISNYTRESLFARRKFRIIMNGPIAAWHARQPAKKRHAWASIFVGS